MAKKKDRRPARRVRPTSRRLLDGLEEVERLLRRRQKVEARHLLEELDRRHPGREEVLGRLVPLLLELGDVRAYEAGCQRLLKLRPNDPDLALAFGAACLQNAHPALALQTFRWVRERWPDHPKAADAGNALTALEGLVNERLADMKVSGLEGLELAVLHEQVQIELEQGHYSRARELAAQLLRRQPQFVPALNNTGEAWFQDGNSAEAIAAAQRALDIDPENYHALSNMTRYLCLSGQLPQARAWAERLKALPTHTPEVATKKAEALSCLGDDQGVLDAFAAVGPERPAAAGGPEAFLLHLAAVAAYRLGREEDARDYWRRALEQQPGFELARDNLADLKRPVGERNVPWAFPMAHWLRRQTIEALMASLERATRDRKDAPVTADVRRYLKAHPELVGLVPLLLDHGDPGGREFALRLAQMAGTPELLQALRDFALSQRGPDRARMEAAQAASQAGLMPAGSVRLWLEGEWRQIILMGFELHGEPTPSYPSHVEAEVKAARDALNHRDGVTAERVLKQALEKAPDDPSILNNLALAYQVQGRQDEAVALTRQIHERHPDYLFARTTLARLAIQDGELDKAKALLEPILHRRRLHFSEFATLCDAEIDLLLTEGNEESARSWLEMWEQAYPDHPNLKRWQDLLPPRPGRRPPGSRPRF
jgi:tetratricopeptide (TPR) repeat protein